MTIDEYISEMAGLLGDFAREWRQHIEAGAPQLMDDTEWDEQFLAFLELKRDPP